MRDLVNIDFSQTLHKVLTVHRGFKAFFAFDFFHVK